MRSHLAAMAQNSTGERSAGVVDWKRASNVAADSLESVESYTKRLRPAGHEIANMSGRLSYMEKS
jgi:hypothetical protein